MKSSIALVAAAAFLCLVAFPTLTVGIWPQVEGWPKPLEISRHDMLFSTSHNLNYGDSKVWKCTYSNGSDPAISISPSTPSTPSPSTPSTPSPSPPTPKTSPPPPTPKTSPPPTPKTSPPPTPKTSPPPPVPTIPPPTPNKSPSPSPPSEDKPSNPSQEHHHHQNQWEHVDSCMRNMGQVTMCRVQIEISFFTRMFRVSDHCCNLIVNMKNECEDVVLGFFTDPFFVPLVRCTCHVTY